jgi:hypothetical protein
MGSENLDATGNLKETSSINEDLSNLQQHIRNTKGFAYRNSTLCKILKASIGGNSKTALLVTMTPHISAQRSTHNAMVFGLEGKKVKQEASIMVAATKEQLYGSLMRAK